MDYTWEQGQNWMYTMDVKDKVISSFALLCTPSKKQYYPS